MNIKRPALWRFFMEWFRPIVDMVAAQRFLRLKRVKRGINGHKVLVIPGFMASHISTKALRTYLDKLGYHALDWGLGRNYAKLEQADQLSDLVSQHSEEGPLTIIGWSLGGLYARKLAAEHPDKIKKVITLASPYRHLDAPNNAAWLFSFFQRLRGQTKQKDPAWVAELPMPVPVPSVAFYTKEDGIVPWEACCDFDDPTDHQNIEVYTSHNALGVNRYVLEKLAEVLSS